MQLLFSREEISEYREEITRASPKNDGNDKGRWTGTPQLITWNHYFAGQFANPPRPPSYLTRCRNIKNILLFYLAVGMVIYADKITVLCKSSARTIMH